MKPILKTLITLIPTLYLIGCGTAAKIDYIEMSTNHNDSIEKKVYIEEQFQEIYWKDKGMHFIGTKPKPEEVSIRDYDINKKLPEDGVLTVNFEREFKTIPMLRMLRPKLEKMIAIGGGTVTQNQEEAEYILKSTLQFGPTTVPAYAQKNIGESIGKRALTLGLVPTGYFVIKNDYLLELALRDKSDQLIAHKKYQVNNSVKSSSSDLNWSQRDNNTNEAMKLYENSLNKNLSDFLSTVKSNQVANKN